MFMCILHITLDFPIIKLSLYLNYVLYVVVGELSLVNLHLMLDYERVFL